jgi:circadian clock protein KaiB
MKTTKAAAGGKNNEKEVYLLRLYIAGISPNSTRAISNLKKICSKYLSEKYELEVIDIYQQVERAFEDQLVALPLLIKRSPGVVRRLIGDMSDEQRVLKGLGLHV